MARIEDLVNREVLANVPVRTEVTTQAEARARGAMMIFEEKYGDSVRLLRIGRESVELCGGTHASRTGDIGLFKIVSDANVGAGGRRIEAVTGFGALELTRRLSSTLQRAADTLKAPVGELTARVEKTLERERELQREIESLKRQLMTGGSGGAAEVTTLAGGNHPQAVASCNATHPRACGYLSAVIHLAGAPLAEESVCLAAGGILSA